jgi:hypothetical protein
VIHLDVLPPPQRAFWEHRLHEIPRGWVLYGGTAIALHVGHRQSRDFDFFSSDDLDRDALRRGCQFVREAKTLQDELNTLTQRVEPRDYVDIAALLRSGLTINEGVAALLALYGRRASGLQSVKTIAWFKDGDLERVLDVEIRDTLTRAAATYDPRTPPAAKRSARLD